ncbi:Uncharacterised protein [uncultured archaeon]|nr:Uncharacterised protein [uncultured archaeon]
MANYYDVFEGMKKAWENWRDSELLKWVAIEFAAGIGLLVVLGILLVAMIGVDNLMSMAGGSLRSNTPAMQALIGILLPFFGIAVLAFLVYGLVCFFFLTPRIMRAALAVNGAKVPAKLPSMVDWFMLHLRLFFINISCWYDKRLLMPAAVVLALAVMCAVIGFAAPAAFVGAAIFGALALFCWMVGIIIHGIRTKFAAWMFLRGDGAEGKMPYTSYKLVHGQTLEVFLAYFIFGIVFGLLAAVVGIVRILIRLVPCIGPVIDLVINLAFSFFTQGFNMAITADIFLFFDKAGPAKPAPASAGKGSGTPAKKKK